MPRAASHRVFANSIKLVVDCTKREKFYPWPLARRTPRWVLDTGMAVSHCSMGSYLRRWLLASGIIRAIEFIEVTAKSRAKSGLPAVMLLH